jgi:hypothetical protein
MKSLLALLLVSGPVLADDASFLRCRDVSDPAKRLECYDSVKVTPRAAVVETRQSQEKSFGLAIRPEDRIEAIESHIPGSFDGWEAGDRIKLANGQVWQVIDDSTGVVYGKDLKVKVARGAIGAMYMEIAGSRKMPKVRRIQ